jgi:ferredoxin
VNSHPPRGAVYLRVDPIACDGVGICSHLAPDLIVVDSWGYPIVDSRPLRRSEWRTAEGVANACPRKALYIDTT